MLYTLHSAISIFFGNGHTRICFFQASFCVAKLCPAVCAAYCRLCRIFCSLDFHFSKTMTFNSSESSLCCWSKASPPFFVLNLLSHAFLDGWLRILVLYNRI